MEWLAECLARPGLERAEQGHHSEAQKWSDKAVQKSKAGAKHYLSRPWDVSHSIILKTGVTTRS